MAGGGGRPFGAPQKIVVTGGMTSTHTHGVSVFRAAIILLLLQMTACSGGAAAPVVITGKTVYQGMAIEEVRVRVLRLQGNEWEEFASVRSGYHGSFIVKTNPGMVRLEAKGEIYKDNRKIPLAGRIAVLEVSSGIRRVERVVIELAPVPEDPGG